MAKTYRNLWPQVVDWRNLLLAYRRCRRRKRYRQPATEFDFAWEEQLLRLQQELQTGAYFPGAYQYFHISDPKPRLISAAPFRDRIVHHAIVNVLEPLFEPSFIDDSYACRLGRGTHKAIQRAQQFQKRFAWCLKTDIVKFFPSVDHEVMLGVLQRKVADPLLLRLLQQILASCEGVAGDDGGPVWFPGDDLLSVLRPKGLPIGNLTSQFFANVLLNPVDHFIKQTLRIPGYLRYADDLLLFSDDRQQLWEAVEGLTQRLGQYRLRLHPRKTHVQPSRCWLTWLGMRILGSRCRISQQGIHRFIRRMRRQRREYAAGAIDASRVRQSLHAWLGHTSAVTEAQVLKVLMRQHCVFSR
jgi:RNA-directed DNA polymerase